MGERPLEIISLGAGVQSTTMALMAAHGELTPMPDCAIFADTGAEPDYVYQTVADLEELLPFPVYRVMKGEGLKSAILASTEAKGDGSYKGRFAGAPFYTTSQTDLGMGMLRRQCTREFKIEPITKKVRELAGLKPRQRAKPGQIVARQWIGISWDERQRMKEPRERWLQHRWPLIEKHMTRGHCLEWMQAHNLPLPQKSACTFCPYRTNAEWREMKADHPEAWQDAVAVDAAIRNGVRGTKEQLYVHQSMAPLDQTDLTDASAGQISFLDECEGMCGV
ncbi:MAG: hypothetical protein AAF564_22255 [Bacteroidota bacterium]